MTKSIKAVFTGAKSTGTKFISTTLGYKAVGAAAVAATVGLSALVAHAQSNLIAIDGSSTVFPITEAMAEEFMGSNPNVNISVGVSGTGGGFEKFCAGETVISDASRPIKESEAALCAENGIEFEEIAVATDAITVVINPENDWATNLTTDQLKTIWAPESEDTITNWNQIDPAFPNEPLNLYGPGTDSGTFDYFTDEINGEEGASRADYTASEDDNVLVLGVSGDTNALGYFGMSYYLANPGTLQSVAIASEATNGDYVAPTPDNIEAYIPLARPIFIYVDKNAVASRPEVKSFVEFYLNTAMSTDIISEVGYVPLDDEAYSASLGLL